ncbi:MAG: hypothetical protein R3C19_22570 [Planctomycetaceae bacterium]
MRILFARTGDVVCPDCGLSVRSFTAESASRHLLTVAGGARAMLCFRPTGFTDGTSTADVIEHLVQQGFARAIRGGETARIEELDANRITVDELHIVADRIRIDAG